MGGTGKAECREAAGVIRVLNVISDTNIGGAGRVILNYLRYADRKRFEIWIALPLGEMPPSVRLSLAAGLTAMMRSA